LSAGAPSQTPLGSLKRSLRPPSWISGGLLLREGGEGTRVEGRGRERRVREGRGKGKGRGRRGRGGIGRGKDRVGPQTEAWPPELFSWRRRCVNEKDTVPAENRGEKNAKFAQNLRENCAENALKMR